MLVTLVSIMPVAAVCPLIYTFIFIIIDKSDEYQLIAFILYFKGSQYLSQGFIRMVLGFSLYVFCVTLPADDDQHHCEDYGPGIAGSFYVNAAAFLVQVVLVWIAFFLLPCSEEKGRSSLKTLEHEHGTIASSSKTKGGYLWPLLIYDFVCFLICMSIAFAVAVMHESWDAWPVKHTLFACQIAYGYLSLPFFLFTIPFFQAVLTHAVPTAYDKNGRVVKFKKPPKKATSESEAAKRSMMEKVMPKAELDEFVDNMKAIYEARASRMLDQMKSAAATAKKSGRDLVGREQPTPAPITLGPSSTE